MNDAVIAAPAEAAPVAPAIIAENTTDSIALETTNPLKTTNDAPPPAKTAEPKKPPSAMDALKSAEAKINASEKAKADAAKPVDDKVVVKDAVKPAEKTVAPKVTDATKPVDAAKPAIEPPARWTPTAKEKWATLDDEVKSETVRTISELEKGYEKHKVSAEKWADLKEYDDLATKYGVTVKDALRNYTSIEKGLASSDPATKLAAIEEVMRVAKISPKDYAAHILNQPADAVASKAEQTIRQLQDKVMSLEKGLQGVTGTFEQQQRQQMEASLDEWASDKPMAEHLATQIAAFVKEGLSLDDAYAKATEEFQALALSAGFIPRAAQDDTIKPFPAQTPKERKSLTGAPGAGSFPVTQKPSNSVEEAVKRAFAQIG